MSRARDNARDFVVWCTREIARLDAKRAAIPKADIAVGGSVADATSLSLQGQALGLRQARERFCNQFGAWLFMPKDGD